MRTSKRVNLRRAISGGLRRLGASWTGFLALLAFFFLVMPLAGNAETAPKLEVPIPIMALTDTTKLDNYLVLPWISQYIRGLYSYSVVIVGFLAGVMMVIGGFQYMTAGADPGKVGAAKERIKNALVGMFLAIGAYTIAQTVNPALTKLTDVQLQTVITNKLGERVALGDGMPLEVMQNQQSWDLAKPPAPPAPEPVPAQDAQGNYIAQGHCPADMILIPHSDAYTPPNGSSNVDAFCIDKFEAPNVQGSKPFNGVNEWEADQYCNQSGKRLCSISEWRRACLGPKGENTYGYGKDFVPGIYVSTGETMKWGVKKVGSTPAPCNYDTVKTTQITGAIHDLDPYQGSSTFNNYQTKPDFSILNPAMLTDPTWGKKFTAVKTALEKVALQEPSGMRSKCVTAEGVFDMTANVQEIVVSDEGAKLTTAQRIAKGIIGGSGKPYRWLGFFYSPIAHLGNTKAKPTCTISWGGDHNVGWRAFENGFRCCLNVNVPPPQPPTSTGQ